MTDKEKRELDAWIAEHVMGWKRVDQLADLEVDGSNFALNIGTRIPIRWGSPQWLFFSPTTDPAAAMLVLVKCYEKLGKSLCVGPSTLGAEVFIGGQYEKTNRMAATIELAICLFAQQLFTPPQNRKKNYEPTRRK